MTERPSVATRLITAVVAALGFLPIANWVAGGFAEPRYALYADEWLTGTAIAVGGGVVLALLARNVPALWREGTADALGRFHARRFPLFAALLALAAFALYAAIARLVFGARPLFIDELGQMLQARIYAGGALTAPLPAHPEFFGTLQMIERGGRAFSQFPPGGPAMLALGEFAGGAAWLVNPLSGAASAALFAFIARRAEPRTNAAAAAAIVFALAPFTAFMAGTHMSHVTALAWTLVGVAGLAAVTDAPAAGGRSAAAAFASGVGFGVAATIRPVDAFAFALPAGLWYLARAAVALRDRRNAAFRVPELLAAGAGVALPMAVVLWVNARTTGSALLSGYELYWGKGHNLGFHESPWGTMHTPARGLELVSLYFLQLQRYLFETPLPSLLPVVGALALAPRGLRPLDRYLLASGGLLVALYFAYWHNGFYLGPRFLYSLAPVLALWAARFPGLLRDSRIGTRHPLVYRATVYALLISAAVAALYAAPLRARQYAASFPSQRWDADSAARAAGVRGALVLVREGWGAELVVRMRALGVRQGDAERLYRGADACALDAALTALERDASARDSAAAARALYELLRGPGPVVVRQEIGPGASVNVRPGSSYGPRCLRRVAESSGGVLALAPILATRRDTSVVYARDLHARDTLLLREYPDRPIYLLRPAAPTPDAPPAFVPVQRDSLLRAWEADARFE